MLVSLDLFNQYSGNYEDSSNAIELKTNLLKSAEEIVKGYLGYDPNSKSYSHMLSGIGDNRLYLKARNVTAVGSLRIDGAVIDTANVLLDDDHITLTAGTFNSGVDNVSIRYTAGFTSANLPDSIKTTILNIATLMLMESNGNIGITGQTVGDTSRNYISYTNYSKYLDRISQYKVGIL